MDLTPELKQKLIDKNVWDSAGRQKLAKGFQNPLRFRTDAIAQWRRSVVIEQVPFGTIAYWETDIGVVSAFIGKEGDAIKTEVRSTRVNAEFFNITSVPLYDIDELAERRFDLPTRTIEVASAEVAAKEDTRGYALFTFTTTAGFGSIAPNAALATAAPFVPDVFADAIGALIANGVPVARAYMNPAEYADMLKLGRENLDIDTHRGVVATGQLPKLYGVEIITSRIVPRGTVFVLGDKKYVGRLAERIPLTVLNVEDVMNGKIGFRVMEQIAMLIHGALGIQRIDVAR